MAAVGAPQRLRNTALVTTAEECAAGRSHLGGQRRIVGRLPVVGAGQPDGYRHHERLGPVVP